MVVLGSVDVPTVAAFIEAFAAVNYTPKIFIAAAGPDQGQAFLERGRHRQRHRHHGAQRLVRRLPERAQPRHGAGLHRQVRRHRLRHQRGRGRVLLGGRGRWRPRSTRHRTALYQQTVANWLHSGTRVQTVLGPAQFNSDRREHAAPSSRSSSSGSRAPGGTGCARFVQVLPAAAGLP